MAQDKGIYPPGGSDLDESEAKELVRELAAGFQESVVDVLCAKVLEMADKYGARGLVLAGGVAANALLRQEVTRRSPLPVIIPQPKLCTDNGAMIAACAYYQYRRDEPVGLGIDVDPSLSLG